MNSIPVEGIELFNTMESWPYALVLVTIDGTPRYHSFNVLGQNDLNETVLDRTVDRLDFYLADYGWEASRNEEGTQIFLEETGPSPVDVEVYVEILCYD